MEGRFLRLKKERWLEEILGKALLTIACRDRKEEMEPGVYWPSMVGHCLRKAWFHYVEGVPPIDEKTAGILLAGEKLHELIAEALAETMGGSVQAEAEFEMDLGGVKVSGRADDLILASSGRPVVVEVKTMSGRAYWPPKAPKRGHLYQLALYMKHFRAEEGYVLYVNRATLELRAFHVSYSEDLFRQAADRILRLHRHVRDRTPPEPEGRLYDDMAWQCDRCPFAKKCEAVNDELLGGGVPTLPGT